MQPFAPIPTPALEHWRRVRFKVFHLGGFLLLCCGIALAWRELLRPLTFPGQAEVIQASVTATEAGILTNLWVTGFQQVKAGDPIAELNPTDARALNSRLEAMRDHMRLSFERLALAANGSGTSNGNPDLHHALRVEEEKIKAFEQKLAPVRLLAPINGAVTAIHHQPGEQILPGQPVVTITSQECQRILGFVPPAFPIVPQVGMKVEIRGRSRGKKKGCAKIIGVGPQLESITNVLVFSLSGRGPAAQTYGRAVSISLPPGVHFLPGEPLEIKLLQ